MIISVASGKGGTGKTTVAVALARSINYCQFIDYDVEAPNASLFLKPDIKYIKKVTIRQPYFLTNTDKSFKRCADFCHYNAVASIGDEVVFFSELCHGCGGCILVGPEGAVREKDVEIGEISKGFCPPGINFLMGNLKPGNMRTPTVQNELEKNIEYDNHVIIDCPPGTSCSMVMSVKNSDFCILVTEPTPFGLNDLMISVDVLKNLKIPFGVIVNRFGIGNDEVLNYCKNNNIKIIAKIPNDLNIAKYYSKGLSLIDFDPIWKNKFNDIISEIEKEVLKK
ncbi:MAG: ATP-binding protein [Actinobacteria bacterium]|nr:ATP-binding protein [Cyanobacteriota bacterium]MCL5771484.1 ATP-binding protein [Actinomycetota bacterium]